MFSSLLQFQEEVQVTETEYIEACMEANIALQELGREMDAYSTGYAAMENLIEAMKNGTVDEALLQYANGAGIDEVVGHTLSMESISADQIALEEEKGGIWNAICRFFRKLYDIIDGLIKKLLGIKTKIEEFEKYARDHKDEILKAMENPNGSTSNVRGYDRYHFGGKAGKTQLESVHPWAWHEAHNKFATYMVDFFKQFTEIKDLVDKVFVQTNDFEAAKLTPEANGGKFLYAEKLSNEGAPVTATTFGEAFKKAGWEAFFSRSESINNPYEPALEAINKVVKGTDGLEAKYKDDDPNKAKIGNLVMKIGRGLARLTSTITYAQTRYKTDIMGFAYLRPGK